MIPPLSQTAQPVRTDVASLMTKLILKLSSNPLALTKPNNVKAMHVAGAVISIAGTSAQQTPLESSMGLRYIHCICLEAKECKVTQREDASLTYNV